jgi:hypothetical protein
MKIQEPAIVGESARSMRDTTRLLLNINRGRSISPPPLTALSISLALSLKELYREFLTLSGERPPTRADTIKRRTPIAAQLLIDPLIISPSYSS